MSRGAETPAERRYAEKGGGVSTRVGIASALIGKSVRNYGPVLSGFEG